MKNITRVLICSLLISISAFAQDMDTHQKKGEDIMNNGDYAAAYEEFKTAITFDTATVGNGILYSYAGICAMQLNLNDEAKPLFETAIARGFADERLYEWLGIICGREKDYACQEEIYLKAIENFPDLQHTYKTRLCNTYYYSKQYEKVVPLAEEILAVDPDDLKVRKFYAGSLSRLKKTTEAFEAYKKVLEYEPEDENANMFVGNYYYLVGKSKLDRETKKYEAIATPSRVQYHEFTKKNQAIIADYYTKALPYLETAYKVGQNQNVKKILFAIYTKKGDKESAEKYK